MSWIRRLRDTLRPRHLHDEVAEELRHHRAMRERREGLGGSFNGAGSVAAERAHEATRERDILPWLESWLQDFRHALRGLRRQPGFAAVVVLTLGLGIGANTAIFSALNGLLLRGLPVHDPAGLRLVEWSARQFPAFPGIGLGNACPVAMAPGRVRACVVPLDFYRQLAAAPDLFSSLAAFDGGGAYNLSGHGEPAIAQGERVSGSYFATLGVRPALGRLLSPEDDRPEAAPAVVLSYAYWQRAFGASPTVIGQTIAVNQVLCTIVGVSAPGFTHFVPGDVYDLWLPLALEARLNPARYASEAGMALFTLAGRLAPGMAQARAEAAASQIWTRDLLGGPHPLALARDQPRIRLPSAQAALSGSRALYSHALWILMLGVGTILLITCANIAGMLLARSSARHREIAVRRALGASRARIFRQMVAESLVLAALGGALGVGLAALGTRALAAMVAAGTGQPLGFAIGLDGRVLLFALGASLLAGLLFGLAPGWHSLGLSLTPALKDGSGAHRRGRHRLNPGHALVVGQVALSLVVLAGAGVLVRSLQNLQRTDDGFPTAGLLTIRLSPTLIGYRGPALIRLYQQLQSRLEAVPGVTAVGVASRMVLTQNLQDGFTVEPFQPPVHGGAAAAVQADLLEVGPGFLTALQVPLLAGRDLAARDFSANPGAPVPTVVNALFAKAYFGSTDSAVGQRFGPPRSPYWVVGVAADAKFDSLRRPVRPTVYVADEEGSATFVLRTATPSDDLLPNLRRAVAAVAPDLPLREVSTEAGNISRILFQDILLARLASLFAALALLLAGLGLFGLLSHEVGRRTHEFGIRMALGAGRRRIFQNVIGLGLVLVGAGITVGCWLAGAATRILASRLFEVQPGDPTTLAAVAGLLLGVGGAACLIPARRATRIAPLDALREE